MSRVERARRLAGVLTYALSTGVIALAGSADVARAQSSERVGFRAQLSPDTIYVGQQATYSLTVRIPSAIRQRLRRNPEFVPPEARGMLAYELPLARVAENGNEAERHTFRRALFVLTPGRYSIAPARLTYALPQSTSFFSREEEQVLRAEGVSLVAIDPPTRGRPGEWRGAVGSWRASARVEPADPRVGDPVVLTLRLEGEGNPTLLPRPPLAIAWADVVADDERVELEAAPLILGGAKEFTWLLTPRESGARSVPAIEYAFFDPVARGYAVARSAPVALNVRSGAMVAVPPRRSPLRDSLPLSLRPSLGGPVTLGIPGPAWWLVAALLAPLPVAWLRWRPRRRGRAQDAALPRQSTRALFEISVRQRTGIDLGQHTAPGTLAAALRVEGVSAETAQEAESLRDACDAAVYGADGRAAKESLLRPRAEALLKRVADEARRRGAVVVLFLLLGTACVAARGANERAMQAFTEGRTAYVGQDYARARDAFARAVNAAPHDPDAWFNLGAAAWQASDTAIAVLGWQRALRLEPRDRALRALLTRVRAPQHRGAARVWPVPPVAVAALALLCWWAGWLVAFQRQRSGGRLRGSLLLLLPAVALAGASAWLDATLRARHLAVVVQTSPLRALPALGADPGAVPLAGEVARILERRGVWLRLELDGGREGWYPTDRTAPLGRD